MLNKISSPKNGFRKSDYGLFLFLLFVLILINAFLNLVFGQEIEAYKSYAKFNINNISTYVWNNGEMDRNPDKSGGFEFSPRSGSKLVFSNGIALGGKVSEIWKGLQEIGEHEIEFDRRGLTRGFTYIT